MTDGHKSDKLPLPVEPIIELLPFNRSDVGLSSMEPRGAEPGRDASLPTDEQIAGRGDLGGGVDRRRQADFDRVARPYRRLEYLTLGRRLERCRFSLLDEVRGRRMALVLGDGDGRALARLLEATPELAVDAVDSSAAMLELLRSRCRAAVATGRLKTHCEAAEAFVGRLEACERRYDLVMTHFFLDCFDDEAVEAMVREIAAAMTEDGVWLVSEFRIPEGWLHGLATVLVRGLYIAFRVLTGLRVTRLPRYEALMVKAGFTRVRRRLSLGGILTSEVWARGSHPGE